MYISIYTTGGTIDKVYFDAKSDFKVGNPQIEDILHEANVTISYKITTLFCKDSLELTDEDRATIVSQIAVDEAKHILITHGTDTMVNTAMALEHIKNKTIVLVGSLSPARFKNSDAVFNIGFAAAAVQLLDPGVYIAMNGHVFEAHHVKKNRAANRFEPA